MNQLSSFLEDTGLSQRDLSRQLGVDPGTVSRLLSGKMRPSLHLAIAIERLTGGRVPAASWIDRDAA